MADSYQAQSGLWRSPTIVVVTVVAAAVVIGVVVVVMAAVVVVVGSIVTIQVFSGSYGKWEPLRTTDALLFTFSTKFYTILQNSTQFCPFRN